MEPVPIPSQPESSSQPKKPAKPEQHAHILSAFEEMSRTHGPRSVVMGELAKTLGMSTKTLYKSFPKKKQLVAALMEKWSAELLANQSQRISEGMVPQKRIEVAAVEWLEQTSQFSEVFWSQLERDFPDAYAIYEKERREFLNRARTNLANSICDDLNPDLALSNLLAIIGNSSNPHLCDRLNLTRKDAMIQAVELWAKGALKVEARIQRD